MGFLKRLLSLGGKKNKKDSRPHIVHNVPVPELPWSQSQDAPLISNEDEHEAAVGRLLRSSSARFAESTELNYANLPPLPHPINNVIQTPASSSLSIASTTLTRQGTYNVTVHKRRRHASTEPPVPPLPNSTDNDASNKPANKKRKSLLTADDSRVLRLRSDPSVASLLSLYDDHGKLAADAFSNDTPREKPTAKSAPTTMNTRPQPKIEPLRTGDEDRERAQVKRSGSTLRQLLGASTSSDPNNPDNSGSGEGDISWAERFLAETESASSHSSIGLETPITTHSTHFYTEPLKGGGDSFSIDLDASTATIDNPALSSMEVEVSATSDMLPDIDESMHGEATTGNANGVGNTPRRASQVFDFLTRGRQSTAVETVMEDTSISAGVDTDMALERTLPELPSCFSSPSSDDHHQHGATSKFKFADPPTFTFTPTMTVTEDEDDTHKGLRVALPALPDNTPRPVRHHSHQRSNSAANTHANTYATTKTTHQRSESQDLRSTFSDDSHTDIDVTDSSNNAFTGTTVPFTPLVNRAVHPHTFTHTQVENTVHEDQVLDSYTNDVNDGLAEKEKKNDIKVMLNGPTKVIVTAPTPGFNPSGPGRLPRGPRALPPPRSGAAMERRRSALAERSNSNSAWSPNRISRERSGSQSSAGMSDASGSGGSSTVGNKSISDPFTLGHPRRRANTAHAAAQRVRSPSISSINSFTRALCGERDSKEERASGYTIREKEREKERVRARVQERSEKENQSHHLDGQQQQQKRSRSRSPLALARSTLGLSVKTELPATPMRSQSTSGGRAALLKTVVQQAIAFHPPLPPSSFPARYDQDRDQDREVDAPNDYDHHSGKRLRARTPSPTSSSEMSPVGRQMMLDVRQQRQNARQAERERAATRRGGSERRHGYA